MLEPMIPAPIMTMFFGSEWGAMAWRFEIESVVLSVARLANEMLTEA